MKTKFTLLWAILPLLGFSQTTKEILHQFQQQNPSISFYDAQVFASLSKEQQDRLKDRVIVFQGDILSSNLTAWSNEKSNTLLTQQKWSAEETTIIKNWLALHQEVKIVPRSMFLEGNEAMRSEYLANDCLILQGETLSMDDIQQYNANH